MIFKGTVYQKIRNSVIIYSAVSSQTRSFCFCGYCAILISIIMQHNTFKFLALYTLEQRKGE